MENIEETRKELQMLVDKGLEYANKKDVPSLCFINGLAIGIASRLLGDLTRINDNSEFIEKLRKERVIW